jgi:hypothetical protein
MAKLLDRLVEAIEHATWLDGPADVLAARRSAVSRFVAYRRRDRATCAVIWRTNLDARWNLAENVPVDFPTVP